MLFALFLAKAGLLAEGFAISPVDVIIHGQLRGRAGSRERRPRELGAVARREDLELGKARRDPARR